MYQKFFRLTYLSCILVFFPLLAHAELSPREAWDNLKKLLETGGYQVLGQEVSVGSNLSIKNVQIFFDVDKQTDIIFNIEAIKLSGNTDGFVYISLPEEIYVKYLNEDEFGYKTEASVLVRARQLEFKVSGKPSKVLYEFTALSAGFALVELLDNGVASSDFSANMELVLADVKSAITSTGGSKIEVKSLLSTSGASIKGGVNLLNVPVELSFQYVMNQLKSNSVSNEPKISLNEDFELALEKGFFSTSNFTFDKSKLSLSAATPGGPVSLTFTTGPSSLTSAISQAGFVIQSENENTVFNLNLPNVEGDFELDFSEFSSSLNIPLLAKSGEQKFGMSVNLSGLNFSDNVWNIFDVNDLMPNDAASIEFAMEGLTILDEGLSSEAIMENQNLDPLELGQILNFQLKEFLLTALGMKIEASGNFQFDNEDFKTFEGIPRPMGKASLKIEGSNEFISRLEDMQLFPSETIMGARMMLALIMRATGNDVLLSEFVIDEKGKIYANGQRLR